MCFRPGMLTSRYYYDSALKLREESLDMQNYNQSIMAIKVYIHGQICALVYADFIIQWLKK